MKDPILQCLEALALFGGEIRHFEWHPRGYLRRAAWCVATSRGPRGCELRVDRRRATQDVHTAAGFKEHEIRFLYVQARIFNVPWDRPHADYTAATPMQRPVRVEDVVWDVLAFPGFAPYAAWARAVETEPQAVLIDGLVGAITRTAGAAKLLVIPGAISTAWGSPHTAATYTYANPDAPW